MATKIYKALLCSSMSMSITLPNGNSEKIYFSGGVSYDAREIAPTYTTSKEEIQKELEKKENGFGKFYILDKTIDIDKSLPNMEKSDDLTEYKEEIKYKTIQNLRALLKVKLPDLKIPLTAKEEEIVAIAKENKIKAVKISKND